MTKCWAWALPLAALLTSPGCASGGRNLPVMAAAAPGGYRLGPGDELRVVVIGLDAMNSNYRVDDTGMIALPMLNPINVDGKTVREAEALIGDNIRARNIVIDPRVSAQVQTYRPFFITGEVQRPGQYPYVPGMSLMSAVAIAGGYTFRADTKGATITRASRKGRAAQDTPVLPGDTILVPEGWF